MVDRVGTSRRSVNAPSGGPEWPLRASEVCELLGLTGQIDYRQLSRLLALADELSPKPQRTAKGDRPIRRERTWRKFSRDDVLRVMVIIDLCGGRGSFADIPTDDQRSRTTRRRLRRPHPVRQACLALRAPPYGREDPLLDVPMLRLGPRVLAFINGTFEDPVERGQIAFEGCAPVIGSVTTSVRSRHPELIDELDRRRQWLEPPTSPHDPA